MLTLRIRHCADSILDGYVFADRNAARMWLAQPWVNRALVEIDKVEVIPRLPCPRCGQPTEHPEVRLIRRLTPTEVADL